MAEFMSWVGAVAVGGLALYGLLDIVDAIICRSVARDK